MNLYDKFQCISWPFLLLISMTACVGFVSLYSAAGGSMDPWAGKQVARFCIGMAGLVVTAMIDIRVWLKFAYVIFGAVVLLLVYVDISGHTSMGAQRWIDLGFMQLQPSEPMKIATVLAFARFFSRRDGGRRQKSAVHHRAARPAGAAGGAGHDPARPWHGNHVGSRCGRDVLPRGRCLLDVPRGRGGRRCRHAGAVALPA